MMKNATLSQLKTVDKTKPSNLTVEDNCPLDALINQYLNDG